MKFSCLPAQSQTVTQPKVSLASAMCSAELASSVLAADITSTVILPLPLLPPRAEFDVSISEALVWFDLSGDSLLPGYKTPYYEYFYHLSP